MAPGGAQRVGVLGERLGVTLDPLKHTDREDDLLAANGRQPQDLDAETAKLRGDSTRIRPR